MSHSCQAAALSWVLTAAQASQYFVGAPCDGHCASSCCKVCFCDLVSQLLLPAQLQQLLSTALSLLRLHSTQQHTCVCCACMQLPACPHSPCAMHDGGAVSALCVLPHSKSSVR